MFKVASGTQTESVESSKPKRETRRKLRDNNFNSEREREAGSNKRENSGLKRVKQLSVAVACGFLDLRLETQRVFGINAYNYYFFFCCVCVYFPNCTPRLIDNNCSYWQLARGLEDLNASLLSWCGKQVLDKLNWTVYFAILLFLFSSCTRKTSCWSWLAAEMSLLFMRFLTKVLDLAEGQCIIDHRTCMFKGMWKLFSI